MQRRAALTPVPPSLTCPKVTFHVRAGISGFPSPAQDYVTERLDLNDYLVQHPSSTFLVTVEGDSMTDARVQPGDLLIIDRALSPRHGQMVVAVVDGEMMVKTLKHQGKRPGLYSANPAYAPIPLADRDIQIWGVVTFVIHRAG
ncbi:LexA family protein [Larsenimonas rhizosphaerae]|uniref:LexA family protein n=1 Tax=Larsenimonas rhizosphaerae TaxID=2944682 RepID=UPI002033DA4E|nr:translesion error-prone DNA polymerase V autoproteolytic subunit [Larsenimonas rhizosphaerae]MCM2130275.1 translesion error-prone DNA polymerase V autoproteolytic subunit [Larsenimonas rhizosphaerae]